MPRPLRRFYADSDAAQEGRPSRVPQRRRTSSSTSSARACFSCCYALAFWDLTTAMWAGLAALLLRQIGHAVLEPPCHDKEAVLLGHTPTRPDPRALLPGRVRGAGEPIDGDGAGGTVGGAALFLWTALVVVGRVAYHRRQGRLARAGLVRQAHHGSRHGPAGLLAALSRGQGAVRVCGRSGGSRSAADGRSPSRGRAVLGCASRDDERSGSGGRARRPRLGGRHRRSRQVRGGAREPRGAGEPVVEDSSDSGRVQRGHMTSPAARGQSWGRPRSLQGRRGRGRAVRQEPSPRERRRQLEHQQASGKVDVKIT